MYKCLPVWYLTLWLNLNYIKCLVSVLSEKKSSVPQKKEEYLNIIMNFLLIFSSSSEPPSFSILSLVFKMHSERAVVSFSLKQGLS